MEPGQNTAQETADLKPFLHIREVIKSIETFTVLQGDKMSRHIYGRLTGCKMYFIMTSIVNDFQVDNVSNKLQLHVSKLWLR
jgi:hypothetical protein